ncbi:MAG: hypothetical protein KKF56_02990 [Nanoarchaeota archaeon]|nr:hypothetical protein [Nanoarchaeota archaeon]
MSKGITREEQLNHLRELKARGNNYVCLGCNTVYMKKPQEEVNDGHGGHYMDMCRCGSDLFVTVDRMIKHISERVTD